MPGHNRNARYGQKADALPRGGGRKKRDAKDPQLRQPLPEKGPAERKRQCDQKQGENNSRHKRPRLTAEAKSQPSSVPGESYSEQTPSTPAVNVLVPAIVQSSDINRPPEATPFGLDVDTSPRDSHQQSAIAGPSATPQPLAGISTVVAAPNALPNEINFGGLHSIENTNVAFPLRMFYQGSTYKIFRVGRDEECEIRVSGLGVGGRHCFLVLQIEDRDGLPIRRRLWLKRSDPKTRLLRTYVVVDGVRQKLRDQILVPNGSRIRFGSGGWFDYRAAKFSELYEGESGFYGSLNSSVHRVKRRGDSLPFVVKVIPQEKIRMAITELMAFKALGYHPRIVRLVEAFYDTQTQVHRLVLEPASMDLDTYVTQRRGPGQAFLTSHAPRMTAQLSSAVAHIHGHNMAHRDLKPQNVLVRVKGLGNADIILCDLGIVRLNTRPIRPQWFAGSDGWFAPGSFMSYPRDDRLVDCYGIGRILYFILTVFPWPVETLDSNAACGCNIQCPGPCVRKTLAYDALVDAGIEKKCIDFLKNLLVGFPEECMDISEVLQHPYIARTLSKLSAN